MVVSGLLLKVLIKIQQAVENLFDFNSVSISVPLFDCVGIGVNLSREDYSLELIEIGRKVTFNL